MRLSARTPADATTPKETPLLDTLTLRTQAEQIAALVVPVPGRPPLERDPDTIQLLLASLADGNYRQTACRVAGISPQTLYNALKRAEAGDNAAVALVDAVENAEAMAEAEMVGCVRNAAKKGPQYWAAGATFLERKSPDRWGRRTDEGSSPKVVVQIGASQSDITVNVIANYQTHSTSEGLSSQSLTDTSVATFASETQGRNLLAAGAKAIDVVNMSAPATSSQAHEPATLPGKRRGNIRGTRARRPVPQRGRKRAGGKG